MSKIDLSKYGITGVTEIVHNPSYEQLFEEETKPGLQGFEKGQLTDMGAVNVMTGVYTGRSPKDKFFVMDDTTKDTIWWTSDEYKNDNKPLSQQSWKVLKEIADKQLSNKRLFVVDTFCGANENSRLKIRFIMEVAWQAHFVTNMFIRPTAEELAQIAVMTGRTTRAIAGFEPRIAMLSFSTKGSAKHEMVDKVVRATDLAKQMDPSLAIDGELQADAAIVPGIGASKAPGSKIAGKANVLVFPTLEVGNIAYKLVQRMAHAEAIGPILQGMAAPINDLSRGCSVDDIVSLVAITACQAGGME